MKCVLFAASKHCQSKPSHIIGIVNPIYYPNSQDIQDSWGMEVDADRVSLTCYFNIVYLHNTHTLLCKLIILFGIIPS